MRGVVQIWAIVLIALAIVGYFAYSEMTAPKHTGSLPIPTSMPYEVGGSSGSGFGLLSVQTVNTISNDPELSGDVVHIVLVAPGNYQSAQVGLKPSLESFLSGQFLIGNDAQLTMTIKNQSLLYNINYYNTIVYGGQISMGVIDSCNYNNVNTCTSGYMGNPVYQVGFCSNTNPVTGQYSYYKNNYCFSANNVPQYQKASIGGFPNANYDIEFKLAKGAEVLTANINPQQQSSSLGDWCKIRWQYNGVGNQLPGVPSNVVLLRSLAETNWKEVPEDPYYIAYQNAYNDYAGTSVQDIASKYSKMNTANAALNAMRQQMKGQFTNVYEYFPNYQVILPVIALDCKFTYFNMVAPVGMPQVVSVGSDPIIENNAAKYPVTMKNIGSASDTFGISLVCPSQVTYNANRLQLNTGQSGTTTLIVEGMASSQICEVKAYSINNAEKFDKVQVMLNIFKQNCPANFQCCKDSPAYYDRTCQSQIKFRDVSGYVQNGVVIKTGTYYQQNYGCSSFLCVESDKVDLNSITSCYSQDQPVACPTSVPTNGPAPTAPLVSVEAPHPVSPSPTLAPTATIGVQPTVLPPSGKPADQTWMYVLAGILILVIVGMMFIR